MGANDIKVYMTWCIEKNKTTMTVKSIVISYQRMCFINFNFFSFNIPLWL